MNFIKWFIYILFFLFIIAIPVNTFAQQRNYQVFLSKDNISWIWRGQLDIQQRTGGKSQFQLNNLFTSNLFKETGLGDKWKDENKLNTGWERRFGSNLKTAISFNSHVFSDENTFIKFSKHLLLQEIKYTPRKEIRIAPGMGWASEDIHSYRDQGWYSQMSVDIRNINLGGYVNNTEGFSSAYFFAGRKNQKHSYFLSFNKKFSDYAMDSIRIGYEFTDNTYHLSRNEEIENVEVNSRFLLNHLNYKFSGYTFLDIETRLSERIVSQSNPNLTNNRKELDFSNRISFRYLGRRIQSGLVISNSQVNNLATRRSQKGPEFRTDVEGLQAAFNLFYNWRFSESDMLKTNFSYTKYEYNSPDTSQNVDEDDLRFIAGLIYSHKFSPYFKLKINTSVYLYHQIYIHANRSANNNWNRIFSLAPSFHFKLPNRFEHTNSIKILANYTVYDFEELLPEVRSFIYRKLIYTDSTSVPISGGLKIVGIYQLEKEDNGTFYKDIFAQQISRELTSHLIDLTLVYFRIQGIQLSTGLNWYFRKEWSFNEDKLLVRNYRAFSPRLSVIYNVKKNLLLHITFSPKTYRDLNVKRKIFATGQLRMKYLF